VQTIPPITSMRTGVHMTAIPESLHILHILHFGSQILEDLFRLRDCPQLTQHSHIGRLRSRRENIFLLTAFYELESQKLVNKLWVLPGPKPIRGGKAFELKFFVPI